MFIERYLQALNRRSHIKYPIPWKTKKRKGDGPFLLSGELEDACLLGMLSGVVELYVYANVADGDFQNDTGGHLASDQTSVQFRQTGFNQFYIVVDHADVFKSVHSESPTMVNE
jgi:hypothetical protein